MLLEIGPDRKKIKFFLSIGFFLLKLNFILAKELIFFLCLIKVRPDLNFYLGLINNSDSQTINQIIWLLDANQFSIRCFKGTLKYKKKI
ncbi:hypothetical protein BpHYR1_050005 [Brachionus plicatilis]|uniref:Uncharacterized protein n=1 Tax=Brachionus plicatilis TaxID=10195 RepID=A0A3M7RF92_BRAPC|nr:hypothetical protein BpHYR1_050005 [Brachionus plicatilis]